MNSLQGKKVLITGGAGFIGSELAHQLAAAGSEVIVVDNLVNGKRENLQDILSGNVRLEVADIRDIEKMRSLINGVDILFHLACLGVRHSIHSPRENHDVNGTATLDLLALSRDANVGRFVYVSSSEIYGTAVEVPMTEECPPFPHTVYGASKLAGDCYTRAYCKTYGFPTVVVRPFNSFGPRSHHEGDSGEVIPKFLLRGMAGLPMIIFGDGQQTRDFTHVTDTARGIILAGTSEKAIGETINLGYGREITINELASEVRSLLSKPNAPIEFIEPRPGDVLRLYADSSKAKSLLDYEPHFTLKMGLDNLKKWYEELNVDPAELLKNERVRNWQEVK